MTNAEWRKIQNEAFYMQKGHPLRRAVDEYDRLRAAVAFVQKVLKQRPPPWAVGEAGTDSHLAVPEKPLRALGRIYSEGEPAEPCPASK